MPTCPYCGYLDGHYDNCSVVKALDDFYGTQTYIKAGIVQSIDGCATTRWTKQLPDGEYDIFVLRRKDK